MLSSNVSLSTHIVHHQFDGIVSKSSAPQLGGPVTHAETSCHKGTLPMLDRDVHSQMRFWKTYIDTLTTMV